MYKSMSNRLSFLFEEKGMKEILVKLLSDYNRPYLTKVMLLNDPYDSRDHIEKRGFLCVNFCFAFPHWF